MFRLLAVFFLVAVPFFVTAFRIHSFSIGRSQQQLQLYSVGSKIESEIASIFDQGLISNRREGSTEDSSKSPQLEKLIASLEDQYAKNTRKIPAVKDPRIDGVWKLLYTSSPGTNSPIQRTFTSVESFSIYQVVSLLDTSKSFLSSADNVKLPDVSNTVCFGENVRLRVTALASTADRPFIAPRRGNGKILGLNIFGVSSTESQKFVKMDDQRIDFAFQDARFEPAKLPFYVPYPVPFKLLGDEAKGWIDTTYLSDRYTVKRGNKGTIFLLERADPTTDATAAWAQAPPPYEKKIKTSTAKEPKTSTKKSTTTTTVSAVTASGNGVVEKEVKMEVKKVALVFPAQLSTENDYRQLSAAIQEATAFECFAAPLARLDWPLGLAPSFISPDYLGGTLKPEKVLPWYFKKIDAAVERALSENPDCDVEITLVGHSIGGWIARAWLSGWAGSGFKKRVKGLVTLGSPHNPPPTGTLFEKFDQTRGLLSYINKEYPANFEKGVAYTSVIGRQVQGRVIDPDKLIDPEKVLAFFSYIALQGDGYAEGDGIIPIETATLTGAETIIIENCRHSNFVPSALGDSIQLPAVQWYGSESILQQWIRVLR